jgi:hypothetical protein
MTGTRIDPVKKTRVTFIDGKKKRVSPAEYASFTVLDLKKKLLVGPFSHTAPGGVFHDTMEKRAVNDSDKLEAIGMKGHDSFVKEYDITFHYDPIYSQEAQEATTSSSSVVSKPAVVMVINLLIRVDGDNVNIQLDGRSDLYNPLQTLNMKMRDFSELRFGDLLDKLDDTWPKFESKGGYRLNSNGTKDAISLRSKLEFNGIKATPNIKEKYALAFDIDTSAPPPKTTPSRVTEKTTHTTTPSSSSSTQVSNTTETKAKNVNEPKSNTTETKAKNVNEPKIRNIAMTSDEPKIRNISMTSDNEPHHQPAQTIVEKEEDFNIDIEIVPVTYKIHIRSTSSTGNHSGRLDYHDSDSALSIDELLKKANIPWTGTGKKGQFSHDQVKKAISSNESLQRLGIRPPPSSTYNLNFKIPVKTTVTSNRPNTAQRPVKPHKTGQFDQLKLEVRVFLDDGDVVQLNLRGQARDWKGDMEIPLKSPDFNRLTIDELLSKLGKRWPILEPEGWLQSIEKTIAFNGNDKLTAIGITPNAEHTSSFILIFPISDEKPAVNQDYSAAKERAAAAAALKQQQQQTSGNVHSSGTNRGIQEGYIGVNVRMFYDEPSYYIQLHGIAGDIRVEADITLSKSAYESLTFGELKKKLRRWPETSSAGKFHSQSGNVNFTDSDKPFALGMVAPADGKPTIYQFSWELKV